MKAHTIPLKSSILLPIDFIGPGNADEVVNAIVHSLEGRSPQLSFKFRNVCSETETHLIAKMFSDSGWKIEMNISSDKKDLYISLS